MCKKILVFIILTVNILAFSQVPELKNGDFLFQDLDCGALCDAIENATFNDKKYKISHVGIVLIENDSVFVIEAYNGVTKTPLKNFLNRSKTKENKPRVVISRIKKEYQKYIPDFIFKLKQQIGKEYDTEFKLYNDKFYCSELIFETFLDENNKPLFSIKPMTFKNKLTGKTDKVWIDYFKKQNIPIPEGELGSNPADYLLDDKLNILLFMY
jgi:uncharacterized protein YycO